MSDAPEHPPRGSPRRQATSGKGTAFPVDVSGDSRTRRTLGVFLAGPIIWSVHFLVVYLAVEAGCTGEGPGLAAFDPPVPTVVTLVATAVAAVACLLAAGMAYRRWTRDRHEVVDDGGAEPPDRRGSLALAGALLSGLGFLTVLFVGLPALALPAC